MPKILVIDDDPLYREMMVEVLKGEGFETIEADNGMAGIEQARTYRPDLVVSDIVMEQADGYKVLSTLKNDESTSNIPFIITTGWSSKGGQRQGMSLGADDYLSKPFNATELVDTVWAQLKKKEALRQEVDKKLSTISVRISTTLPNELRKPLQQILGLAQIISEQHNTLPAHEMGEMARFIYASGIRIERWVENYTLYLQLEMLSMDPIQKVSFHRQQVNSVRSVIREKAVSIANWRRRSADLKLTLADGSAPISKEYLAKLLEELLDNAFKFSPSGSMVEVKTAFIPGKFGLAVVDKGRGMSSEEVAEVGAFIQFGQKEYGQQGFGLGLAIAKLITELHGGLVKIHSHPGKGTKVAVEIPLRS